MTMRRFAAVAPFALLFAPSLALASGTTDLISQLAGLFYVIVGLTLTFACLLMLAGVILWVARFGTDETYRVESIHLMEWGVATLFTLILVLGVVEFVQHYTSIVLYIITIVIIGLVIWLVVTALADGGKKKEDDE